MSLAVASEQDAQKFDEKLFPDLDRSHLNSGQMLWAETWSYGVKTIVTDDEYHGMKKDHEPKNVTSPPVTN